MSRSVFDQEESAKVYHEMLQSRLARKRLGPNSEGREKLLRECESSEQLLVAIKEARLADPAQTTDQIALAYQFLFLDEAIGLKTRLFDAGHPDVLERFDLALARVQEKYGLRITDTEASFVQSLKKDTVMDMPVIDFKYRKKSTIALFEKLFLLGNKGYATKSQRFQPPFDEKAKELVQSLLEGRLDESKFDLNFWNAVLEDYHAFTFVIPDYAGSLCSLYGNLFPNDKQRNNCVIEASGWRSNRPHHRRIFVQGYHPIAQDETTPDKLLFELLIARRGDHQEGLALAYAQHKGFSLPAEELKLRKDLLPMIRGTSSVQSLRDLLFSSAHKYHMSH